MPYIGNQPGTGVRSRFIYTATASQTTFSGADDNSKTLKYADSDYIDVYLNGVCLVPGTDYTASTKTSVVLTQAASLNDTLEVVAYDIASMADTVSKADGGTFEGDLGILSASPDLTFTNSTSEDTDGGRESTITFKGLQSGGEESTLAEIRTSHDGTADDQKGDLIFKTNDGSDGVSPTERLRIESDGVIHAKSGVLEINSESTASSGEIDKIRFRKAHTSGIGTGEYDQAELRSFTENGYAGGLNVYTSRSTGGGSYASTLAAKFDETGDLQISDGNLVIATDGHGIDFSATEGSGASSSILDDYEEGTYTASVTCGSGSVTLNTSYDILSYTKIGRIVTVTGLIVVSSVSSPSGDLSVSLPLASANLTEGSERTAPVSMHYYNGSGVTDGNTYYNVCQFLNIGSLSSMRLFVQRHNGLYVTSPADFCGGGSDLQINFTYFTA